MEGREKNLPRPPGSSLRALSPSSLWAVLSTSTAPPPPATLNLWSCIPRGGVVSHANSLASWSLAEIIRQYPSPVLCGKGVPWDAVDGSSMVSII